MIAAPLARGLWLLARPGNAAMAAAASLAAGVEASVGAVPWLPLGFASAAALMGVAGANAWNDAQDARIDAKAHPGRAIPRGLLTVQQARRAAAVFLAVGVAVAWAASIPTGLLAVALVALLALYETWGKRSGFLGNVVVAVVVASTFLLGAIAVVAAQMDVEAPWPIRLDLAAAMAGLAFLANLAREVQKDVQDAAHDAGERTTLPHQLGTRRSLVFAGFLLLLAVGLGLLVWFVGIGGPYWLPMMVPALAVFLAAGVVRPASRAAFATKMGMLLALVGFAAIALI